jgi:hypothetical protein
LWPNEGGRRSRCETRVREGVLQRAVNEGTAREVLNIPCRPGVLWEQGVGGSNPLTPTNLFCYVGNSLAAGPSRSDVFRTV